MNTTSSSKLNSAKAELVQRSNSFISALKPIDRNVAQNAALTPSKRRLAYSESLDSPVSAKKATSEDIVSQTAHIWLPHAAKYLSFNDLNTLCSVSRNIRRACLEDLAPEFQRLLEVMLIRFQGTFGSSSSPASQREWARRASRQIYWLTKGNCDFLRRLVCVCRDCEQCGRSLSSLTSYGKFLDSGVGVARAMKRLEEHIPAIAEQITYIKPQWISLTVEWAKQSTGPDTVARFLLAALCAVCNVAGNAPNGGGATPKRLEKLRLYYEGGSEYAIFIDPIQNTVHVSILDARLLSEQLCGAIESLAHFNERCGFCGTLGEVEEGVKRVLGVGEVCRDPRLSDSKHAHCLFKLAVYSHVIGKRLKGFAIMPSDEFEVDYSGGRTVVKFNWSASWYEMKRENVGGLIRRLQRHGRMIDDGDNDDVEFSDGINDNSDDDGGDTDELESFITLFAE